MEDFIAKSVVVGVDFVFQCNQISSQFPPKEEGGTASSI